MKYVSNDQIASWYGAPCKQPTTTVRIAGSRVSVNKKAKRLFKWQNRVFKTQNPVYYKKDLCERHLDDWGGLCRPVTGNDGPVTVSNASKHAWWLADDIDADENVRGVPMKQSEMWNKGQKSVLLLEDSGFTWGGRFSTPDTHHFEVAVSEEWINKRFDRFGRPRRWFKKHLRMLGHDV